MVMDLALSLVAGNSHTQIVHHFVQCVEVIFENIFSFLEEFFFFITYTLEIINFRIKKVL
jgi:hypothetical protein